MTMNWLASHRPSTARRASRRICAGRVRVEFGLAVVVLGVVASLALQRVAELQVSANDARDDTRAAQARSVDALAQACFPHPIAAPDAGAAPAVSPPSCLSNRPQGATP
jgi:hypothetical protein